MIVTKLTCFLCLGVLSVSTIPATRGIFDTVETLLKTFNDNFITATNSADSELAALNVSFNALGQRTNQIVATEFQAAADAFLQQIASLKTRAGELGVAIDDCVGNSETEINELPPAARASVSSCVLTEVSAGYGIVAASRVQVFSASGQGAIFQEELDECKSEAEILQAACATTLATNITLSIDQVTQDIDRQVRIAQQYTDELKDELLVCTAGQVAAVSSRGALIVAEVAGCANERFLDAPEPTTPAPTPALLPTITPPSDTTPTDTPPLI
ncbi:uncharacterized protein LOC132705843 [Cylas formicarius]|uniref:uncharacterized protein LOC132705843 n=1 Tax=Cylas formicarius TaxID=197179 RepID=UPI0029583606|nr:uncharacterized protein LOC132705843 [Cylas formicarius]